MTSKKKTMSTTNPRLVPAPNLGEAVPTKWYPTLDFRSTVLKHLAQDPTTIRVSVPRNTPIPDANNNAVEPTELFKAIVSDITEALPFLTEPISHETKTVILNTGYLKQQILDAAATYKAAVYHLKKPLLIAINSPIKILIGNI